MNAKLSEPSSEEHFREDAMVGTGNVDFLPYNEILHMASSNLIFHEVGTKPPIKSLGTEPVLRTLEIPHLNFFLMEMRGS